MDYRAALHYVVFVFQERCQLSTEQYRTAHVANVFDPKIRLRTPLNLPKIWDFAILWAFFVTYNSSAVQLGFDNYRMLPKSTES